MPERMIVEVYRNLHKHGPGGEPVYSLRKTGIVVGHVTSVWISNASFVVRESGRQRVLRERRKNVHAWVKGARASAPSEPGFLVAVTYNPYAGPTFYERETGEPVTGAPLVHIGPRGVEVWVKLAAA